MVCTQGVVTVTDEEIDRLLALETFEISCSHVGAATIIRLYESQGFKKLSHRIDDTGRLWVTFRDENVTKDPQSS